MQPRNSQHSGFLKHTSSVRNLSILFLMLLVVIALPESHPARATARDGDLEPIEYPMLFGPQLVEHMVVLGNRICFSGFSLESGQELWCSDGTAAGTVMVKDIQPGEEWSSPYDLVNFGGTLYFVADDGVHGRELWRSDGTANGTLMVKDINPGSASALGRLEDQDEYIGRLTVSGNYLFFAAADCDNHYQLWRSDGTAAGTVPMPGFANTGAGNFADVNGTLFFIARDSTHGAELWKTNGTAAGTGLVKDMVPGPDWGDALYFTSVGGTLFFSLYADIDDTSGFHLWRSDGTAAGTTMILNTQEPLEPEMLTNVNGTLFFVAQDDEHGHELWRSDGTAAGTRRVADIFPGPESAFENLHSFPSPAAALGNTLFFVANDGHRLFGTELWRSDGTVAGTSSLGVSMSPGRSGIGISSYLQEFTACNGTLFFTRAGDQQLELWRSDGTIRNTVLLKQFPEVTYDPSQIKPESTMACAQNTLFFAAGIPNEQNAAQTLWRSDGTAAGTRLVQPKQSVFLPLID